ncbi:MAG: 4-hydroxy-tetrahydrodipicolinate reductase, partial [Novosphingobium sp.]
MAGIGIIGSAGRMGQAIAAALHAAGETPAGGIDQGGDAEALARASDVLVDFSSPAALEANLDAASAARVPILVGT